MITKNDYERYLGETAPENFERLEYISLNELKSIMQVPVPDDESLCYEDFTKALIEQIKFYSVNPELLDSIGSSGYSLGSYSESASNQKENSKSINRISPVAYDILLNCGLLYSGLERC